MSRLVFLYFLLLILTFGFERADAQLAVNLVNCHDGDTCEFQKPNGQRIKVRLDGVDAPEIGKPFAKEARDFARSFLSGRDVQLSCSGKSFHRRVCRVSVQGQDLGQALVSQGLAWDAPKYSKGEYKMDQYKAMVVRRGLWEQPSPESPTCQRRRSKQAKMMCQINPYFQD